MQKRNISVFMIWAFFVGLIIVGNAVGQANRSTISGFVFDTARRPISQVYVELINEFSVVQRVRTDASGRFTFRAVAHGRFTVKALPFGTNFEERQEDVEIAGTGVRGQPITENVQLDIYLKLRKSSANAPFQNAVIYAQDVPRTAEVAYNNAVKDLESDRAGAGIQGLEKALSIFPDYFMALQRLGIVRVTQEKFEDAADIFRRALKVNERNFDCWYGLAYAEYAMKKFAESVAASEKAVAQRSESMEAHLLLGLGLRMTKDLPKAEEAMKRAVRLSDGRSSDVHWQLALLYGKDMEKYAEAAKELESYLKLSPDAPNKEEIKKLIKQFREKAKA